MKVCPYRIVSVLDSVFRTCPADGSVSAFLYPNNEAYQHSLGSYWRADIQQIYPACIVQPLSTEDVSLTLSTLVESNDYTVLGSTNAEYAVTIDLLMLNSTVYNPETSTASIQPGARWKSVYKALGEYNVAVPGGRGGAVGVGGFITGGGNSFHSAQYGFTCDAVVNFEIVLPTGTITRANKTYNADLFKALKGGSGNFGIVTRFDLEALPQESLWGGIVTYDHVSTVDAQVEALVNFTNLVHLDPSVSLIPLYTYNSQLGFPIIANSLVYTKPIPYPEAFKAFYNLPNISDSTRFTSLEGLVGELEPGGGLHENFFTLTFANDPRIIQKAISIQDRLIEELKRSVKSVNWSIISLFQPLPGLFAEIGKRKGGNVLGLDEDNNYIRETSMDELEEFAKSMGGGYKYVYLNYAADTQHPLRSYGEKNLEFLKAVAETYDPHDIFQEQVPGGFKVSRA
ncbi:hypothetical protein BDV12DRAFT_186112 [Aspergillus spectabilis]